MTNEQFNAIAQVMANTRPVWVRTAQSRLQWDADCEALAVYFKTQNRAFGQARFLNACNEWEKVE